MTSHKTVYLDHAATTPMHPAAIEAMTAVLATVGNASSLHGTGFGADTDTTGFGGDRGATGWLKTVVDIGPELRGKNITLLFAVWDGGDGVLDSTALIDNLAWSTNSASGAPVTVPQ